MRAIVDTCIIIDALQKRELFWENASKLFLAAANKKFDGGITAKSVTDIYYLIHRYTHSDADTRKILNMLFILPAAWQSILKKYIHPPDARQGLPLSSEHSVLLLIS